MGQGGGGRRPGEAGAISQRALQSEEGFGLSLGNSRSPKSHCSCRGLHGQKGGAGVYCPMWRKVKVATVAGVGAAAGLRCSGDASHSSVVVVPVAGIRPSSLTPAPP